MNLHRDLLELQLIGYLGFMVIFLLGGTIIYQSFLGTDTRILQGIIVAIIAFCMGGITKSVLEYRCQQKTQ